MLEGITIKSECQLCRWYEERKGKMLSFKDGQTYFYFGPDKRGKVTISRRLPSGGLEAFTLPIAKLLNFAAHFEGRKEVVREAARQLELDV